LLQNHRSDVADITPLLRIGLVSDEINVFIEVTDV